MTFIEDIIDYCITQSVGVKGGTTGGTLFLDFMPETDTLPAAFFISSPAPRSPNIGWSNAGVQVLVRGETYEEAAIFAGRIHNLLDGALSLLLPSGNARILWATGPLPQSIGTDENRRVEVSTNYDIVVRSELATTQTSTGYGQDKDPNLYYL